MLIYYIQLTSTNYFVYIEKSIFELIPVSNTLLKENVINIESFSSNPMFKIFSPLSIKIQDYFYLSFFYFNFYSIIIFLFVAIILSIVILSLSYLLISQNPETEKLSTYECGFEPYEDARHKFEVKFYLVAILFIIFDIEAMYLFPWSISLSNINSIGFCAMIDFIIELGLGFAYIWFVKALDWSN